MVIWRVPSIAVWTRLKDGAFFFLGIEPAMNWVLEHMGDPGRASPSAYLSGVLFLILLPFSQFYFI